jgi:hypothetical protein
MNKYLKYSIVGLLCVGCFDNEFVTQPIFNTETPLGVIPTSTKIVSTSSLTTSGKLNVTLDVTPGAMYSLQLVNIKGEMVDNHGFTAVQARVVKSMDYTKIPNGNYDLTLMATNGNMTKVPVIITH